MTLRERQIISLHTGFLMCDKENVYKYGDEIGETIGCKNLVYNEACSQLKSIVKSDFDSLFGNSDDMSMKDVGMSSKLNKIAGLCIGFGTCLRDDTPFERIKSAFEQIREVADEALKLMKENHGSKERAKEAPETLQKAKPTR